MNLIIHFSEPCSFSKSVKLANQQMYISIDEGRRKQKGRKQEK